MNENEMTPEQRKRRDRNDLLVTLGLGLFVVGTALRIIAMVLA